MAELSTEELDRAAEEAHAFSHTLLHRMPSPNARRHAATVGYLTGSVLCSMGALGLLPLREALAAFRAGLQRALLDVRATTDKRDAVAAGIFVATISTEMDKLR